jgi:hypothetical protein
MFKRSQKQLPLQRHAAVAAAVAWWSVRQHRHATNLAMRRHDGKMMTLDADSLMDLPKRRFARRGVDCYDAKSTTD